MMSTARGRSWIGFRGRWDPEMLTNLRSRPSRVVTNRTWFFTPITLLTNSVRTATISANGIVFVLSQLRTTNAEPVNVSENAYKERTTSRNDTNAIPAANQRLPVLSDVKPDNPSRKKTVHVPTTSHRWTPATKIRKENRTVSGARHQDVEEHRHHERSGGEGSSLLDEALALGRVPDEEHHTGGDQEGCDTGRC